jgi:hypothetical protein
VRAAIFVVLAFVLAACTTGPVLVGPRPTGQEVVTQVEGSSCGLLFFGVLPIGVNERLQRAYDDALAASGKRELADTKIRDRWYVVPLLGLWLCTDVQGVVVR